MKEGGRQKDCDPCWKTVGGSGGMIFTQMHAKLPESAFCRDTISHKNMHRKIYKRSESHSYSNTGAHTQEQVCLINVISLFQHFSSKKKKICRRYRWIHGHQFCSIIGTLCNFRTKNTM